MPSDASRFAAHLAALTSGALAVIFSLTLRPEASTWVVLGLSAAAVLAALAAFAMPDQGWAGRTVELLVVLSGGWTITASRVFSDPSVTRWLCFAGGAAVWALGGLGLVAHERLLEERMRRLIEEERYRLALTRPSAGTDEPLHRAGRP